MRYLFKCAQNHKTGNVLTGLDQAELVVGGLELSAAVLVEEGERERQVLPARQLAESPLCAHAFPSK